MYTSTDDPIEIARTFSRLNEWTGVGGGGRGAGETSGKERKRKSNDWRERGRECRESMKKKKKKKKLADRSAE